MPEIIVDPKDGASSAYGAELEMVTDVAAAVGPVLRARFPRASVIVREPPIVEAVALVFQFGDELHDATIEQQADMHNVMVAIRDTALRLFPTIPLVLELLRPPVAARWGFVAHVQPHPERIYPRLVTASAVLRPSHRGRAIAWLEGD